MRKVSALTTGQIKWAYEMWCIGYTKKQIANALFVHESTIGRVLKGKKRVRPILVYKEGEGK